MSKPPSPPAGQSPPVMPPVLTVTRKDMEQLLPAAWFEEHNTVERVLGPALAAGSVGRRGQASVGPQPYLCADTRLVGVPAMLQWAREGRLTGVLVLTDPHGGRALFVDDGRYVGAVSTHRADRLGEVLWRQGRISLDQLMIAGASIRPGVKLGRAMVELGYLGQNDLFRALRAQALAALAEACMAEDGTMVFLSGLVLKNPLPLEEAQQVVEQALGMAMECRTLQAALQPLDAPVTLAPYPDSRMLTEGEAAMLQLAASARPPLTREALLDRVDLGRLEGLIALSALIRDGFVESWSTADPSDGEQPGTGLLKSLCLGLNVVMAALKESGFGMVDAVISLATSPPEHVREGMALLEVTELGVDTESVLARAEGDPQATFLLEDAVRELYEFAMFEARDTLDEETVAQVTFEVGALGLGNTAG